MTNKQFELTDVHWLMNLIDQIDVGVVVFDRELNVQLWNGFMEQFSGISGFDALNKSLFKSLRDLPESWINAHCQRIFNNHHRVFSNWETRPYITQMPPSLPISGPDRWMYQNISLIPVMDINNEVTQATLLIYDVTEASINQRLLEKEIAISVATNQQLKTQYAKSQALLGELEQTQQQLMQSEKMASVGQLAAGVAHEINNPIGFVNSNFSRMKDYTTSLKQLIGAYEEIISHNDQQAPEILALQQLKTTIDFDFMLEDIDDLVSESQEGIDRVKNIVQGLKDFSRASDDTWGQANINNCIDSTLNICWNEIKYKATVEKNYAEIPVIECIPAQLNQVFMNLLVNAAQAIEKMGQICIETRVDATRVSIIIRDTGAGIPKDKLSKIFDPFFTTKAIGKGTGLGLSIAYGIIEKHQGTISVVSTPGEGTTFTIGLPISRPAPN